MTNIALTRPAWLCGALALCDTERGFALSALNARKIEAIGCSAGKPEAIEPATRKKMAQYRSSIMAIVSATVLTACGGGGTGGGSGSPSSREYVPFEDNGLAQVEIVDSTVRTRAPFRIFGGRHYSSNSVPNGQANGENVFYDIFVTDDRQVMYILAETDLDIQAYVFGYAPNSIPSGISRYSGAATYSLGLGERKFTSDFSMNVDFDERKVTRFKLGEFLDSEEEIDIYDDRPSNNRSGIRNFNHSYYNIPVSVPNQGNINISELEVEGRFFSGDSVNVGGFLSGGTIFGAFAGSR